MTLSMNYQTRVPWPLALLASVALVGTAKADALPDFTKLVTQVSPAVVNISTTRTEGMVEQQGFPSLPDIPPDSPLNDFLKKFFKEQPFGKGPTPHREFQARSLGSGFIVSSDGYVMTNAHVVGDADEIVVALSDRRELKAKLIGMDKPTDVALLKIDADNLPTVKIGNSDDLEVGQWVLAIGSPFGFDHSATQGIVSALGRSLPNEAYVPFIQTDVAVNPGNSGGPLLNLDGNVVGINSQIYSRTGGYMGLSFAIPINVAMDVMHQLQSVGHVSRGWLGVMVQEVTQDLAKSFGFEKPHGALVASVDPNGPAQKAGFKPGDIIVEFDGHPIANSGELPPLVGNTKVGKSVPVTVLRNGEKKTLDVVIAELPGQLETELAAAQAESGPGARLGATVADLTQEQTRQAGVQYGVLVKDVRDGPAAKAGLRPGDIIVQVGRTPIHNVAELRDVVGKLPTGGYVPILVQRGNGSLFLPLYLPTGP